MTATKADSVPIQTWGLDINDVHESTIDGDGDGDGVGVGVGAPVSGVNMMPLTALLVVIFSVTMEMLWYPPAVTWTVYMSGYIIWEVNVPLLSVVTDG